jgi:hypothetical protein
MEVRHFEAFLCPVFMKQEIMCTHYRNAGFRYILLLASIIVFIPTSAVFALQSDGDWLTRVRALVEAKDLLQAENVTNDWLKAYPNDLDARAWQARLHAWTNHWEQAESEYRALIALSPRDADLLAGLSDVLTWQHQDQEALIYIEQALELDPARIDIALRRAQALQRLRRTPEARIAYREILARDASSIEARKSLEETGSARRHELRFHSELNSLSYADNASSFSLSIRSRWNSRWATQGTFSQHHRFGESATGASAGATLNFSPQNAFTIATSIANDNGIIPRATAELEYSHGFHLSETGPVRGLEAVYRQHWMWYRDARVLVLSPSTIIYLPKELNWQIQFSSTRIAITGDSRDWKPSGSTRLSYPFANRASAYLLFAAGSENFEYADQIGRRSARTWGAGIRLAVAAGQEILGYVHYQKYSGGQTITDLGASYALRF